MPTSTANQLRQAAGLRSETLINLRWIAIFGQTGAVLLVYYGLDFALPLKSCLGVIALSAWVNVYLMLTSRTRRRISEQNVFYQLTFDTVQLALLIGFTGGLSNPFLILFAAPVVVAMTALRFRQAGWLFLLVMLASFFFAKFAYPLPWAEGQTVDINSNLYRIGMAAATLITIAFTSIYVWRISAERNRMGAALAATEAVLAHEHRLSALGGLAAATAHELGTPLGTIQLVASEMSRGLATGCVQTESSTPCPITEDVALILSQTKVCRQILGKLSSPGAENDPFHSRLRLSSLLEEISAPKMQADIALSSKVKSKQPEKLSPEPFLPRKPEIMHALSAFLENAMSFAQNKVEINGRWNEKRISITICDDGPGFDPVILEQLGEPYVTSRRGGDAQGRGGLGLGFFISKNLIERTGGKIICGRSSSLGGAMVQIVWPREKIEIATNIKPVQ